MGKSIDIKMEGDDKERLINVGEAICRTFPLISDFTVRKVRNQPRWRCTIVVVGDWTSSDVLLDSEVSDVR